MIKHDYKDLSPSVTAKPTPDNIRDALLIALVSIALVAVFVLATMPPDVTYELSVEGDNQPVSIEFGAMREPVSPPAIAKFHGA